MLARFLLLFVLFSVTLPAWAEGEETVTPDQALVIRADWSRYPITNDQGFWTHRVVGQCQIENASQETLKKVKVDIDIINEFNVRFPALDPQEYRKLKAGKKEYVKFVRHGLPTTGYDQKLMVLITATWEDHQGNEHKLEVPARESYQR